MVTMDKIKDVARQIGVRASAKQVILFGSQARGNANENSDVDFFIIAESGLPRFKRSRELYKMFSPYPFSMDLLVYTPQEVEDSRQSQLSFVSTVLREGKVLYNE